LKLFCLAPTCDTPKHFDAKAGDKGLPFIITGNELSAHWELNKTLPSVPLVTTRLNVPNMEGIDDGIRKAGRITRCQDNSRRTTLGKVEQRVERLYL
jgi:hypothetical protein